jgi:hypothetical protein
VFIVPVSNPSNFRFSSHSAFGIQHCSILLLFSPLINTFARNIAKKENETKRKKKKKKAFFLGFPCQLLHARLDPFYSPFVPEPPYPQILFNQKTRLRSSFGASVL